MLPSKKEQIEALLKGEACELVEKYISPHNISGDSYKVIFTVKKHEILDYLKKNCSLNEVTKQKPGSDDGFYAIPIYSGFKVYEQERGIRFLEHILKSEDEVWESFVKYLLDISGTGLDFT